jgi:hypothetical protein
LVIIFHVNSFLLNKVLTCILILLGYRIKLHFDGYSNVYDFWVNADYPDIFYPKWCEQNSRILQPPKNYKNKFNWTDYFRQKLAFPAPKWNFSSTKHLAVSCILFLLYF